MGLNKSIAKTKVMVQGIDVIYQINNNPLEIIQGFTYLGSLLTSNLSVEKEIDRRIGKAYATFCRFAVRVWENNVLIFAQKSLCLELSGCVTRMDDSRIHKKNYVSPTRDE